MMRPGFIRRLPVFVAALCFLYATPEVTPRKAGISASAASADFKIMNSIFAQAHATAFGQISTAELPDIFAEQKQITVRDFVLRILQYYRGIHVDHTGLGFSPELIRELDLKLALFPFPLKFFDGKAYFDCEFQDIPFGSELAQLNGVALQDILAKFDVVGGSKNSAGKWDDYRLSENFSFLYYLVNGAQKEWRLTLAGKDKEKPRVVVPERPSVLPRRSAAQPQYGQPLFAMFNPSLKGAYLAINTFMPSANKLDSPQSWHNHINLFHQEATEKKSDFLVIDLRYNRGGVMPFSAAAAMWFIEARISDKSRSAARTRVLPYREYAQAVNGMAAREAMLSDTEKYLQSAFADKMTDGYFETRQSEARFLELGPIAEARRFKKIYVLIGPQTYSAAVNFARLLKIGNKNVILVGEETGSPGDGHSAEVMVTYRLPASGLLFEIPLVRVQFQPLVAGQVARRGLQPDVVVKETAEDFVAQRDAVMDYVSQGMSAP